MGWKRPLTYIYSPRDKGLSRGERAWEIASSRCYLASYVSRSLPASADGALPLLSFVADRRPAGPVSGSRPPTAVGPSAKLGS